MSYIVVDVESDGPIMFWSCINGDGWSFIDFRNNQFIKPDSFNSGKCFLTLGESC